MPQSAGEGERERERERGRREKREERERDSYAASCALLLVSNAWLCTSCRAIDVFGI